MPNDCDLAYSLVLPPRDRDGNRYHPTPKLNILNLSVFIYLFNTVESQKHKSHLLKIKLSVQLRATAIHLHLIVHNLFKIQQKQIKSTRLPYSTKQ